MIVLDLPRGMKDFDAGESSSIEHIRLHFRRVSELYGFSFMDPSPMESLATLETKSGPSIRDEIYYFSDKGGREVALRFDFTMGITRYVASQRSMKLPAKISAFGGVFRYDEPQKGRYRYFHQWNLEVYGKPGLESEAELIEMTSRLFDSLRFKDIVIDVSHRGLVESYINEVFDSRDPDLVADILRAIDKISKKSEDEILAEFTEKGYDAARMRRILEFSRIRGSIRDVERSLDTSRLESWDELKGLLASLDNRGVSNVRINLGIVRGLDYYSGTVFEVFDKNSSMGALAGGGRYDTLPAAFGRSDIGAAGVAGGVERMMLVMREQGMAPEPGPDRVAVVYVNDAMQKVALSIASMLRLSGIPSGIDLAGRSVKKQMDLARGARLAIIVGPHELEDGNVILHDMRDGTEGTIPIEDLTADPESILGPGYVI